MFLWWDGLRVNNYVYLQMSMNTCLSQTCWRRWVWTVSFQAPKVASVCSGLKGLLRWRTLQLFGTWRGGGFMQLTQIGPCRLAVEVSGAAMMGTLVKWTGLGRCQRVWHVIRHPMAILSLVGRLCCYSCVMELFYVTRHT